MTKRPVLLDLFCGAGGAARGYVEAGFEVVGIDHRPQPRYPYRFIQGDALDRALWPECDVIHASPPCQRYSQASKRWKGCAEAHPDLVGPTRFALGGSGRPFIIENVPGAPLIDPIMLCGSMFGLGVRRHRLFESSASLPLTAPACDHASQPPRYWIYDHGRWYLSPVAHVFGHGGGKSKGDWPEAMGIDWMVNRELAQAIPPAYTRYIGGQIL
jgi:DNA (cytosine-5)-methyltransferase 1